MTSLACQRFIEVCVCFWPLLSPCLLHFQQKISESDLKDAVIEYDRSAFLLCRWEASLIRRTLAAGGATVARSQSRDEAIHLAKPSFVPGGGGDLGSKDGELLTPDVGEALDASPAASEDGSATPRDAETPATEAGGGNPSNVHLQGLKDTRWEEGAVLDGYPVAFYSPTLKVSEKSKKKTNSFLVSRYVHVISRVSALFCGIDSAG